MAYQRNRAPQNSTVPTKLFKHLHNRRSNVRVASDPQSAKPTCHSSIWIAICMSGPCTWATITIIRIVSISNWSNIRRHPISIILLKHTITSCHKHIRCHLSKRLVILISNRRRSISSITSIRSRGCWRRTVFCITNSSAHHPWMSRWRLISAVNHPHRSIV